eukprot:955219-Rhodomonas_salina.2
MSQQKLSLSAHYCLLCDSTNCLLLLCDSTNCLLCDAVSALLLSELLFAMRCPRRSPPPAAYPSPALVAPAAPAPLSLIHI